MITHPAPVAHANPGASASSRADRLAKATNEQLHAALSYLGVIDPEALDIALTVVPARDTRDPEDDEPLPVCRECGAPVGIFPDQALDWQHFRGGGTTSVAHELYDPGHRPLVTWLLPGEGPEDL
jgi:hypothetical protein